ncbi:MAG: hypothetical protein JWM41_676 [Gemmatimonadetes bacterium]|nr:hypothetical protein [Gemmatimonadota bacterium]
MMNWSLAVILKARTARMTLLLGALVAPAALGAQRCRGCVPEDTMPRTHIVPGFGVRFGAPQKASVALGVVLGEDWQTNGHDHSRNVGLIAEPGLSGGRASLAYVYHGYGSFGSGFAIGPSVLRTWRDPWWAKENVTYVGGDIILWPIVFVGPRVGVFRSVGGNSSGSLKRWLVTFDFGFGL